MYLLLNFELVLNFSHFLQFFDPLIGIWSQQIFKFIRSYHPQTFFILISASYAKFEQILSLTSYIFALRFNFFQCKTERAG